MTRPALSRLERATAQRVLAILRASLATATEALSKDYRPRGDSPSDYDAAFARSTKAALEAEIGRMQRSIEGVVLDSVGRAARVAQTVIGKAAGMPVVVDARVVEFAMETAAEEVRAVSAAVRSSVRSAVTRAVAGGLSHGEMLREIRSAMGGKASAARVERIARTEVNRSYQQQRAAMDEQLSEAGADLIKRWVSQRDNRVRDTHLAIDGQERELSDPFNVGDDASDATEPGEAEGTEANGPLDPALPAEEAINCRCDVLYVPRADARQDYIDKESPVAQETQEGVRVRTLASRRDGSRMLARPDPSRLLGAFDPSQPRDDFGKWTDDGGGPAPGTAKEKKAWSAKVPDEQRDAARAYTEESAGYDLNQRLREKKPLTADQRALATRLDALVASSPPHDPEVILYRGMKLRGPGAGKFLSQMKEGAVVQTRAFGSATIDRKMAMTFTLDKYNPDKYQPVVLEIRTRRGAPLSAGLSAHAREQEVLLPRGDRFRIASVEKKGRLTIVRMLHEDL